MAIIALPLSIALALASGVGPEQGIYTAIVAGFVISLLGGSQVQIAGPTAAFATIVAGIVARSGMDGLAVATILAGIILILMGFCRFGSLIKFIPFTITTGFTSGIAVTIVIGQLKDFFGVVYPEGMPTIETMEKLKAFAAGFVTLNMDAVIVGLVCLAILIVTPYFSEKIPGSLLAVIGGILMVKFLPLNVNTIGDLYTISSALPSFHLPQLSFDMVQSALPDAFTIAVLAAIESLLSCVVADGMINGKHRSDMELAAQGAGNIASALFGGIPATGAIARTAANIKNGGRTPVAGMVHAACAGADSRSLHALRRHDPHAGHCGDSIHGRLQHVSVENLCRAGKKSAPKSDIAVLIITFFLTIVFDLVVAIEFGILLAGLLFMKRMSDVTEVHSWKYAEDEEEAEREKLRQLPPHINVYEISGPLFFGAADEIGRIVARERATCLILRMRSVPSMDSTAMNAMNDLLKRCQQKGNYPDSLPCQSTAYEVMEKAGYVDKVGRENFCENIDAAIAKAEELVK